MKRCNGRRPAIICIGAGKSQIPLILAGKRMGWAVITADRDPHAPGFEYADEVMKTSTHDTRAILAALHELNDHYHFEGVVARTTAAEALHTAATVSEEYGLPGLTREIIQIATEKSTLRNFCSLHDLPAPKGTIVNSVSYGSKTRSYGPKTRSNEPKTRSNEPEIRSNGPETRSNGPETRESEISRLPAITKPDKSCIGKANIHLCTNQADLVLYVAEAMKMSDNGQADVRDLHRGHRCYVSLLDTFGSGILYYLVRRDELVGIGADSQVIRTWGKHTFGHQWNSCATKGRINSYPPSQPIS